MPVQYIGLLFLSWIISIGLMVLHGSDELRRCLSVRLFSFLCHSSSDVKPRGRGQSYEAEAEANFWRLRPRPRPKIIMKKYQTVV